MASKVYFTDMRALPGTSITQKLKKLIHKAGIDNIDFENKYIKIQRLAEWDTMKSHIYAWKAMGFLVANKERILPKKKRIICNKHD